MRKVILTLFIAGVAVFPCWASPPIDIIDLFNEGNIYYGQEKFKEAAAAYEKIVGAGYESEELYYNLGNAYFKNNAPGKAVLNYRRAGRLAPLDADIRANLEHVMSLVKQKSEIPQGGVLMRLFSSLSDNFSLRSIAAIYFTLYFVLFLWALSFIFIKKVRKALGHLGIPVILFFIIAAAILWSKYYDTVICREGVIIAENAGCKFEPFNDATTYFTLYEGDSVIVTFDKGEWVKIKRADNKRGWIKKETLELL